MGDRQQSSRLRTLSSIFHCPQKPKACSDTCTSALPSDGISKYNSILPAPENCYAPRGRIKGELLRTM